MALISENNIINNFIEKTNGSWIDLDEDKGFILQQNSKTDICRIMNAKGIKIAGGDIKSMNKAFKKLVKPWTNCKRGDILAVKRCGGVYSHYAVYVGRGKVIHYSLKKDESPYGVYILKDDFFNFIEEETSFEILSFPENGERPNHKRIDLVKKNRFDINIQLFDNSLLFEKYYRLLNGYHVYSPEETVARAESRIGEKKYSLATNNCEHFAIWCKTGVKESTQVNSIIQYMFG